MHISREKIYLFDPPPTHHTHLAAIPSSRVTAIILSTESTVKHIRLTLEQRAGYQWDVHPRTFLI